MLGFGQSVYFSVCFSLAVRCMPLTSLEVVCLPVVKRCRRASVLSVYSSEITAATEKCLLGSTRLFRTFFPMLITHC